MMKYRNRKVNKRFSVGQLNYLSFASLSGHTLVFLTPVKFPACMISILLFEAFT